MSCFSDLLCKCPSFHKVVTVHARNINDGNLLICRRSIGAEGEGLAIGESQSMRAFLDGR